MTALEPVAALGAALYARLDDALTDIDGKPVMISNHLPDGSRMPYVHIAEGTGFDISCKGEPGQEITLALHVWSEYRGSKEAAAIMRQIARRVRSSPLTVDGYSTAELTLDSTDLIPDTSGDAWHGTVRWRAQLYERL